MEENKVENATEYGYEAVIDSIQRAEAVENPVRSTEYKRVNWSFLAFLGLEIFLMIFLVIWGSELFDLNDVMVSTILAESTILLPALIMLLTGKYEEGICERIGLKAMKPATIGLVFLFGIVMMPIGTLANAISMLWVDNTVLEASGNMLDAPWYMTFISSAVIAPLVEEFTFRGFMFKGYRRDGAGIAAMVVSALAFALMHLNFNQAAYAFVLGFGFAFVVEASGSLWASIMCHFMFNAETVILMFVSEWIDPGVYDDISVDKAELLGSIPGYVVAAGMALIFAVALIYAIAKKQDRLDIIKGLGAPDRKKKNIISAPLVVAFAFCLIYMVVFI